MHKEHFVPNIFKLNFLASDRISPTLFLSFVKHLIYWQFALFHALLIGPTWKGAVSEAGKAAAGRPKCPDAGPKC